MDGFVDSELITELNKRFIDGVKSMVYEINEEYNRRTLIPSIFSEGDIIKLFHGSKGPEHSIYKIVRVFEPRIIDCQDYYHCDDRLKLYFDKEPGHRYICKRKLKGKHKWSNQENDVFICKYNRVQKFSGEDLENNRNNAANWDWVCPEQISYLNLCIDIQNFLHDIDVAKYKNALKEYQSKNFIKKSVIESRPELLEIHKMTQKLRLFKTHIETA